MIKNKKDGFSFAIRAGLYCAVSVLALTLEFFVTAVFIRGAFSFFKNISSLQTVYKAKIIIYDFMGFALITLLNSIIHYYLAALLAINVRNKKHRYIIITISTFIASLFFIKLAAKTGFNSYLPASIPLIASYALGSIMGINEEKEKNPWKGTKYQLFK